MNNIFDFFKKTGSQIIIPFFKLKVFLQIIIIIIIMVCFILLEGYNNLKIIGQMQKVSVQVFNDSAQGLYAVYELRNQLQEMQIGYLKELSWNTQRSSVSVYDSVNPLVIQLQEMYPGETKDIEENLTKVSALLQQPVSQQNYEAIKSILIDVLIRLQEFEGRVRSTATGTITVGNKYSRDSTINTIIILCLSLLSSLGLGLNVALSIAKPLSVMANTANMLAKGDLSKDVNTQGCYEALVMVKGLNHALAGLRNLIHGINQESYSLLVESMNLNATAAESGRAACEVSKAMEELTKASIEQGKQIELTVSTVDELSGLVQKVFTDTNNIETASKKMAESAQLGQQATDVITKEINELYQSTQEVARVILELSQAWGGIGEITAIIHGVTEQTTLLAVDASIEAARAGEHGKGFGVVASETGKLAEQSKKSAQMIADLLNQMEVRIRQAIEVIQKGMDKAEAGKSSVAEAAVTFGNIFQEQREVLSQINVVAASARDMAEKSESVINAVTEVAAISEGNMAETEEISSVSEQQNATAQEVAAMAEKLAQIATELKNSIATFEIGDGK